MRRLTTDIFIEKAKLKRGDEYDYGLVNYINCVAKVKIICKKHGVFEQIPSDHLNGQGCPKCGRDKLKKLFSSNTEEFIKKANIKYDFKYIYNKVIYNNAREKVEIICLKHGSFWQTPNGHLGGHGCPKCAGNEKSNTKEFIEKANIKHDFKYNYSLVDYVGISIKVEIICPIHGSFWQSPRSHLSGRGCPKCAGKNKTTVEFITEVSPIHDFKYNYNKVIYKTNHEKIEIICPIHGSFWQTPNGHLQGRGCPKCGGSQKFSTKEFEEKSNIKHNFKYNYSKVFYKNNNEKVEIICQKHGSFWQTPAIHLSGSGCPKCGDDITKKYKESNRGELIEKANIKHDFKYDYNKVIYVKSNIKIEIICSIHGSFWQTPNSHLSGKGCPKCTKIISDPEIAWLNSLNLPNDKEHRNVYIKIKNRKRGFKVDGFDPATNTVYEFNGDFWHGNPSKFSPEEFNPRAHCTYGELYTRTLEKEQLLKSAGYNVVSIWESEFNSLDKIISE